MQEQKVETVPVRTRGHWRDFHRLPYRVYRDDPQWVPPLLLERKLHFSAKHNPYFEHAEAEYWLAYRNGEPVGRISAQIDRLHLERHRDATGQFGFIEAIDDDAVFAALLSAAENWLRGKGMARATGPISFSLWHEAGLLVEGFDTPPFVMMGHARNYYGKRIENAGYAGVQDLIAYAYPRQLTIPAPLLRILERSERRGELRVRNIRMDRKHLDGEIALIHDILNDAWSDNWGFVPMTKAEIADFARILRLLLKPEDVAIAEYRGEPAAFSMIFPNLNEAIKDLGGRLFPFGWAKLLWRLKIAGTKTMRMPLMGVRKSLQTSPAGAALALAVIREGRTASFAQGLVHGELSWVLDSNVRARRMIEMTGAPPSKRYRIYEKAL
jgi:hypothetical protein